MKQEIGFFDDDANSPGVLVTRLADEAGQIKGLAGQLMGTILQSVSSMFVGLFIAFYYGWELTLVILAAIPVIGIAGYLQLRVLEGSGTKTKKAYEDAGQIAVQSIQNIRTVLTLGKEKLFHQKYLDEIRLPHMQALKGANLASFGFGFSQGVIFMVYALAFYFGSRLIIWDRRTPEDVLKVMFAIIFTAMTAGQTANFMPNAATARIASTSVFALIDRTSRIDYSTGIGEKPDRSGIKGKASVDKAVFNYPSRPDTRVLDGLSISAAPGKMIALVGASGCGKSTVIALLERWYNLNSGVTSIDDLDVTKWELQHLRSQMALVGQEPVLFNTTIRNSIAYGSLEENPTDEQIETVARMANIHDFIVGLPDGYKTMVGEKGGQLSGGQKQRIAIARALCRQPKILLLDEASSALDSESEKIVQAALDKASAGRTTIVIAHRLATIQNAHQIYVVGEGKIKEQGTHFELLEKKGTYFELVGQQNLGKKD